MAMDRFPAVVRGVVRLLCAVSLMAAASSSFAQRADSPREVDPAVALTGWRPPEIPLTEAQKLVHNLGPLQEGFGTGWATYTPDSPMPSADPRDFRGAWATVQKLETRNAYDMYGMDTPYTMTGAQTLARRVTAKKAGRPIGNAGLRCLPPGPIWQFEISGGILGFQTENLVEFAFMEGHGRWNIALNPAVLPGAGQRQYMGRSIGHWDGNTLVVETSDFKQDLWVDTDGTPLSKNGKLITRIRKVNEPDRRPYLELVHTIVDPVNYTHQWSIVRILSWQPNRAKLAEYNCEEQVGDPSGVTDTGFQVEADTQP
jgi:hypothetical protein